MFRSPEKNKDIKIEDIDFNEILERNPSWVSAEEIVENEFSKASSKSKLAAQSLIEELIKKRNEEEFQNKNKKTEDDLTAFFEEMDRLDKEKTAKEEEEKKKRKEKFIIQKQEKEKIKEIEKQQKLLEIKIKFTSKMVEYVRDDEIQNDIKGKYINKKDIFSYWVGFTAKRLAKTFYVLINEKNINKEKINILAKELKEYYYDNKYPILLKNFYEKETEEDIE